ncbi:MAG TPA: cyclic nucleotide-binding domain-containing protein [Chloroflexi bacterium]|nr:cyclic nucleotide-binding domain-containing protein [Chloroflexota bacterium]
MSEMITASENMLNAFQSMEFTRDLEAQHLVKLASMATKATFEAGETIFREGDAGRMIYLIQEGRVGIYIRVPNRGLVTLLTVEPGRLLGWSSLFPPHHKTADARAIVFTQSIAIDAAQLWDACRADHDLGYTIMQQVAEAITSRLIATRLQLLGISTPTQL